jgi:adenosylhomocysteinase
MKESEMGCDVRDLGLAPKGRERIEWAAGEMPVLALIRERFEKERPLDGVRIAACLHVTTETANLMETLAAGGAEVAICASNPLSTQDDVAAALCEQSGIATFAVKGEDTETFFRHINEVLDTHPHITMDDGADMVSVLHKERQDQIAEIMGGTEETTTGVIRLRAMAADGALKYPIVSVNDADTKHLFDNRFGTGQSTIDAIMRSTNRLIAGRTVVVCGYGMCGRGVASRAKGMGAHVIVTEVDPTCALEAVMEGYRVMPIREAARIGDMFVTVTGDTSVIRREHMELMKDGAILANSGHFDVEIDKPALADLAVRTRRIREFVDEYTMADGRRLHLLGEGRLVNLTAAEGHPAAVMDMSFADQALAVEWVVSHHSELAAEVYPVPVEIDKEVARLKLHAMGVEIDTLTAEQDSYLHSWQQGT